MKNLYLWFRVFLLTVALGMAFVPFSNVVYQKWKSIRIGAPQAQSNQVLNVFVQTPVADESPSPTPIAVKSPISDPNALCSRVSEIKHLASRTEPDDPAHIAILDAGETVLPCLIKNLQIQPRWKTREVFQDRRIRELEMSLIFLSLI